MSLDRCTALACSRETSRYDEYDTQTPPALMTGYTPIRVAYRIASIPQGRCHQVRLSE
jgi:hypothetical protein